MTLIRFLERILGALTLDPRRETPVIKMPQAAPMMDVPRASPTPRKLSGNENKIPPEIRIDEDEALGPAG